MVCMDSSPTASSTFIAALQLNVVMRPLFVAWRERIHHCSYAHSRCRMGFGTTSVPWLYSLHMYGWQARSYPFQEPPAASTPTCSGKGATRLTASDEKDGQKDVIFFFEITRKCASRPSKQGFPDPCTKFFKNGSWQVTPPKPWTMKSILTGRHPLIRED